VSGGKFRHTKNEIFPTLFSAQTGQDLNDIFDYSARGPRPMQTHAGFACIIRTNEINSQAHGRETAMKVIREQQLEDLMAKAAGKGVRFADVRAVRGASTTVEVQDGRVEKVHATASHGIGIRVLVDNAWGFSSVNSFREPDMAACLARALDQARALAPHARDIVELAETPPVRGHGGPRNIKKAPETVPVQEKVARLAALERAARAADTRIATTSLQFGDSDTDMTVANTRGTCVRNRSVRTRIALSVVAADQDSRQIAREIIGQQSGFEMIEDLTPENYSLQAVARAVALLSADAPPSGAMPVVFDPDITGLLAHEAFGHNSEADLVRNGESIISGRMGDRVGSDLVNITDDSTIPDAWGSYTYDGEGTPGARRVLVEQGVVRNFLHSLETAAHFKMAPMGSARAQNHQYPPIVRMSNTFFEPGSSSFEDLLKQAGQGLYIKGALGGYVATEKGQFTCSASEGWTIKNGVLDRPVRDVSVSGLVLEALANVIGVSNAFSLEMPGTCGKSGQGMPVNAGGPHILLASLVVGGSG
jgi:TldD protein